MNNSVSYQRFETVYIYFGTVKIVFLDVPGWWWRKLVWSPPWPMWVAALQPFSVFIMFPCNYAARQLILPMKLYGYWKMNQRQQRMLIDWRMTRPMLYFGSISALLRRIFKRWAPLYLWGYYGHIFMTFFFCFNTVIVC